MPPTLVCVVCEIRGVGDGARGGHHNHVGCASLPSRKNGFTCERERERDLLARKLK